MKLIFIVNEYAGGGKSAQIWRKIQSKLTFSYDVFITKYRGHASEIAKQIAQSSQERILLIAIGGDGTVHEVIVGVTGHSHIIIGAIKAGSGNDFARGFRVFNDTNELEQFVHLLRQSDCEIDLQSVAMDSGTIKSKHITEQGFVNNAGIGFDAYVTTKVNDSKLKGILNSIGLGSLIYTIMTVMSLFTFKRFNAKITTSSVTHHFQNVWFVTLCNQPYFGGGMKISPRSIVNDGLLEVTVVHNLSRLKLILMFVTVFLGKHERLKEVTCMQGDQFTIETSAAMVSHVDGEFLGEIQRDEQIICKVNKRSWYLARMDKLKSK